MKTVSYRVYCEALTKLRHEIGGDRRIEVYDMNGEAAAAAEGFEYNGYVIVHGEDA